MRQWSRERQAHGERVGLVPTLGALHDGHVQLVEQAQQRVERVVVSIFVNPLQFGPKEDFSRYPRTLEADLARLAAAKVDLCFCPTLEEMYSSGQEETRVTLPSLTSLLCGKSRPGHFEGVATVVTKLLHIVEPDIVVFGQKDWQQLVIIRQLVADLNFPVSVVGIPTVRESSGLAISSRNRYLSLQEKQKAASIYASLKMALQRYQLGLRDRDALCQEVVSALHQAEIQEEYVEIVDPITLGASPATLTGPALVAVAAWVGGARLIDNLLLSQD